MAQMTAVQISRASGPFEVVKRQVPAPGPNQVRIKVQACGICHSDMFVKEGHWPGLQYPRVTGHEVAGAIDEVGAGVTAWKKGLRGSASAGMAGTAVTVTHVVVGISSIVGISGSRDSVMTAGMRST